MPSHYAFLRGACVVAWQLLKGACPVAHLHAHARGVDRQQEHSPACTALLQEVASVLLQVIKCGCGCSPEVTGATFQFVAVGCQAIQLAKRTMHVASCLLSCQACQAGLQCHVGAVIVGVVGLFQ